MTALMMYVKYLVAVAALAGTAAVGPPAAAHSTCAMHGANVACLSTNHHTILWCDSPSGIARTAARLAIPSR